MSRSPFILVSRSLRTQSLSERRREVPSSRAPSLILPQHYEHQLYHGLYGESSRNLPSCSLSSLPGGAQSWSIVTLVSYMGQLQSSLNFLGTFYG
jgi:hypothetical protein